MVLPVKRQRKHKGHTKNGADSNQVEIIPSATKAKAKQQLRDQGAPVSGKKVKRLEKYLELKLKKDENEQLLQKLSKTRIDTSLLASSRALGRNRETKRESLSRALQERRAGLGSGENDSLLFKVRPETDGDASSEEDDGPSQDLPNVTPAPALPPLPVVQPTQSGSGLKRPLEVDDGGRPVLRKRQKRGGVGGRPQVVQIPEAEESDDAWSGFGSDGEASSDAGASLEDDSAEDDSSEEDASDESDGSDEDEDDDSDSEEDADEDGEEASKIRSSAFKIWAQQQRNAALGIDDPTTTPSILEIPKVANFQPREIEQDPLPRELLPTAETQRVAHFVQVTRPDDIQSARLLLPVVGEEQKIMEAIHNNDIVVICGATGSGKTTQMPQFLFEAGYGSPGTPTSGMIGITQPKRVAAVSMAKRVGQELGSFESTVAYQIRFEGTADADTAIKFMTDGVLLRELATDVALKSYSAIIIDEAHERSVNTDVLVGMLSRVVKLRKELAAEDASCSALKLIIMSATLRIEDMTQNTRLFSKAPPVLQVEGRQFTVTEHFARKTQADYVEDAFKKITRGHKKLPPGGMLVFLTGQNEIVHLAKKLRESETGLKTADSLQVRITAKDAPMEVEDIEFGVTDDWDDQALDAASDEEGGDEAEDETEFDLPPEEEQGTAPRRMQILPLYSMLPTKEQMRVFQPPPDGSRLIVLATNVAETSLTIPGIRYVFDSGRCKEKKYNSLTGVQSLEIGWISKASASQRAGRAGRTGPGHCYRLYSSAVYERDFPEFADPELLCSPIEGVVLQLKAMNLTNVQNFPFPTPPDQLSLIKAERLLGYLSAISEEGKVTTAGTTMSLFPLAPRFARILMVGCRHDCLHYTVALIAGLSVGEIFIPENQIFSDAVAQDKDQGYRTQADVLSEDRQSTLRRAYGSVHKNFCSLDDKSDAIKLLQVVGEFAHASTEDWCERHFVRYKALRDTMQLRRQIIKLLRDNIVGYEGLGYVEKLAMPTARHVAMLKQMVASGFIDHVAIRADKAPTQSTTDSQYSPRRAIDVAYIPLLPLDHDSTSDAKALTKDGQPPPPPRVYIHPSSPLAHISVGECPEYIIYSHLHRGAASFDDNGVKKVPKIRMHALTDVTGSQLASLAKGTPLITYSKPIKEVRVWTGESGQGQMREVLVKPYLRAEGTGGMGWPLPPRKVVQRRVPGKGWVVE